MNQQENQIVSEIVQYIQQSNTPYTDWYIGITEDVQIRLFVDHAVNKETDYWIYRKCFTADQARIIEQDIIINYHTDGGSGGGSENSKFVYAYKKERHTKDY